MDTNNPLKGTELDLTKGAGHEHPDIVIGLNYLCKINGQWWFGQFNRQWYGLNFNGRFDAGTQYDKPGTNASEWQRIIHCKIH